MVALISVLVYAAVGVACALIAHSRGRNAVGWFFIGALLPCFAGLVLVLVLPDLKLEEERHRHLAEENRRLKERLRKERMVADQRHGELTRRIGAHDVALAVDTAGEGARALEGAPPAVTADGAPASDALRAVPWFYAEGAAQHGPLPFDELARRWRDGRVRRETLVWSKGMSAWTAVASVAGLMATLDE